MNRADKCNSEGYLDPTACEGLKNVIKQEAERDKKISLLIHIFRDISFLAGFEIVGRITLRDKKTGREFK